jgi:hypothetical protein
MSNNKPIQFKLFGAILTKIELFWSLTYFFMFFQISLSIFTRKFFATLRTVFVAEILSTCAVNVCFLALLMSALFAKKGAKFDHVVDFDRYDLLVE